MKARLERAPAQLKVGPAELMETALLMHRRAVELNEQHSTVLAEARACGWLHWRPSPSTGILQLSSSQPWADKFTEGSSRMDSSFREDRNSWVPLGVPDPVSALTAPQREELVSYWSDPQPLVVEAEQGLMDELDLRRLQAALLHPSVRSEVEKDLAAVQLCQSQKRGRQKEGATKPQKESRSARASAWKAELGRKRDLEGELWPVRGKAKSARSKKSLKKKLTGKFWSKLSKAKRDRKAAEKKARKKDVASPMLPPVSDELNAFWAGQRVRVTDPKATVLWQNSEATVKRLTAVDKAEVHFVGTASVAAEFHLQDLVVIDGTERKPMSAINLAKLLALEKAAALEAAGGEVKFVTPGQQLEHPELAAAWEMLKAKGRQHSSSTTNSLYLEPAVAEVLYHAAGSKTSPEEAAEHTADWRHLVSTLVDGRALIVVPIREAGHWTVLLVSRSEAGLWTPKYYDSLPYPGSGACRVKAAALLTVVAGLLPEGSCPGVLPDTEVPFVQTDGFSCGFHCVARMEEAFCEFRGQKLYRCYKSVSEIRKSVNAFVQTLLAFKRQQAKKPAGPPLPPPPTPPPPLEAPPPPILAARQTNRQTFGFPYCLPCTVTGRGQGGEAEEPERGEQQGHLIN